MLISLLFEQPLIFFAVALALVISLSIHEFAHAYAADKLGDDTARLLGRVTLDPRAHLDPIGSLLILFAGFGWGKPVPFNPINLANPKRDAAIISFAGPLSNFVLATALALVIHSFGIGPNSVLGDLISLTIFYNIMLGVFNLLPIHPLDGFKVVAGLLPPNLYIQWMQMQQYGLVILMILILTRTTGVIITPIIIFLLSLLGL